MPLTDPVPSSSFDVLERNIQDTDKFANQDTGTFTNRVGKAIKPIPVIEAEALEIVKSIGWTPVGEFATGFTYTKLNDVGRDSFGSWWRYNGSDLPKVIAAGTVPSSPNFSVISFETADNVEWESGKSVGYVLDDYRGAKDELYSQAGVVDNGTQNQLGNSQFVDVLNKSFSRGFNSVSEAVNFNSHVIGNKYNVDDYYGGSSPSGSGILFFKVVAAGTGVADGGKYIDIDVNFQLEQNLKKPYDTKAWGAKHDFNPLTGSGTDNRPFIQAAIDYAQQRGSCIKMQSGNCYLGADRKPGSNPNLSIQLLIGSIWSEGKPYVLNTGIIGQNTNLYAGREGRMLTIGKSKHVKISGINFYHYVGGVITGSRGISDNAIRVCDGSQHVDIFENYMTNHLGWGVDVTSDAEDPSTNNYLCSYINIYQCTIKTRYGNGTRAYNTLSEPMATQGTGGAWCVAVINGENVNVYDCTMIGDVDLENNSSSQTFNDILIYDCRFRSGWVTPQTTIGTDYWHDEPMNPTGTAGTFELRQGVLFNGVGLDTVPRNVVAKNNTFENAYFSTYGKYRMAITGNTGYRGRITVGYEQGGEQITDGSIIMNNYADVTPDTKGFISIAGLLTNAKITNNGVKDILAVPTISLDNAAGRNVVSVSSYEGNMLGGKTNIVSGVTYRVTVNPFMTPVCTFNTAVSLSAGAGSGVLSLYCAGLGNTGNANTYDVVEVAKGTPAGVVTFSAVTKLANGVFYFDVSTAASSGELSFSSPDSYALISVTTV